MPRLGTTLARPVAPQRRLLGEILREQAGLDRATIREALWTQRQTGSPIGEVLLHDDLITETMLARSVAEQCGLPLLAADPAAWQLDAAAAELVPEDVLTRYRLAPVSVDDGVVILAGDGPPSAEAVTAIRQSATAPFRSVIGSHSQLAEIRAQVYGQQHLAVATYGLMARAPDDSARRVLTGAQKFVFGGLVGAAVVALVLAPIAAVVAFNALAMVFYASLSIYKFKLIHNATSHHLELPVTDAEVAALDDRELPVYTILVPLYREASVLPRLVGSLERLDYPRAKLDIKLLFEADDVETLAAARAMALPAHFRLLVVPDAQPKTKPKACNFGLIHAEGEFVVIFDAEDRPDPDQLKKVIVAFGKADPKIRCIQCKLSYFNRTQNLLTRWFTNEYSMWFDLMMPGLDAANAPMPLGGTSNHFYRESLVDLGAWDPYNVTEDADLGIRLHKHGLRTAIVDSTTYEEANSDVWNWIRQRSRWMKGYTQTWLVHMRHPLRLRREIGLRSWLSFQMTIGGTVLVALLNPIYWLLTALWFASHFGLIRSFFPGFVYFAAGFGLYIGNFAFAYINMLGALRRGHYDLVKYALLSPLYWGLASIAAWKGVLQLCYRPFYWEKTHHGLGEESS